MSQMLCQLCQKGAASVRVTDIQHAVEPDGSPRIESVAQRLLCADCAEKLHLPTMPPVAKKGLGGVLSLLKSARRAPGGVELSCPDCGMTLAEFRAKGRLGCPRDYEVFAPQLEPLLLRMHNASVHVGRTPLASEAEQELRRKLQELRTRLEQAIRDEAYELAAQLRDELAALEPGAKPRA